MYKKISKTIILVVFLAFFGIMKVNAYDVAVCYYKFYDSACSDFCGTASTGEKTQRVHITNKGTAYFDDKDGQYHTGNIHNWDNKTEDTTKIFSGYDYFMKNNKCPKYLLVDNDPFNNDEVYFADEKTYDKMVEKVFWGVDNDRNTFKFDHMTGQGFKSDSNKSKSCKPKSNKDYSDPNVVPQEPLKNDFTTYSCGKGFMTGIPVNIPKFTKFIYNFIQFLVPLTLIILGSIDLIKSITGGKEDEIKKGQQVFIKRLIAGALVFFSLAIVKLLVSVVFPDSSKITNCMNCFITGGSECVKENDLPSYSYTNITKSNSEECEE